MRSPSNIERCAKRAVLAVLGFGLGCAAPAQFVHPDADLPFYETVGIVPFESVNADRLAGVKVSNVFFTELLRTRFAEVKEPGQFQAAMSRVRGGTPTNKPWSSTDLAKLGEEAGVQGIFTGIVRDYEMVRVGRESFPLVSLEVRLLDVATGRVVWSASHTRRGGPTMPFTGWREIHTLGELTTQMCRQLLDSLAQG